MQTGYFSAAWGDIKNSPGWLKKMLLLALVACIPIFGSIVLLGYLYGWARDIAWNVHRPLPEKIFGNEDGKLYRRGFFVWLVCLVFSFVPSLVGTILSVVTSGGSVLAFLGGYHGSAVLGYVLLSCLSSLVVIALYVVAVFFIYAGSMRAAIYDTPSSGFQVQRLWAMMRHDFSGLLRIFGMTLIIGLIAVAAFFVVILIGVLLGSLALAVGLSLGGSMQEPFAVLLTVPCVLLVLALFYAMVVCGVFASAMQARALGYWTRQFDVPHWRSQDEPLPFEVAQQPMQG